MDEINEKINTVLNNPQMMQQIMALAQSLGQSGSPSQQDQPVSSKPGSESASPLDASALARLGKLAQRCNIDKDEQTLLRALSPYLSKYKLARLERAMQAAKMAGVASAFLSSGGLRFLTGR